MCNEELMRHSRKVLEQSKWFKHSDGYDHIAVASHWNCYWRKRKKDELGQLLSGPLTRCQQINHMAFKTNDHDRMAFVKLFAGTRCEVTDNKVYDYAMVASLKTDLSPQADWERGEICGFLGNDTSYTSEVCGYGGQCPALARARLGIHPRGDTYASNRLEDTILSGTVPVFTHCDQLNVSPPWHNFSKMAYFWDFLDDNPDFVDINAIMQDTKGYEERLQALLRNQELFDWETTSPFDQYMYHWSRRLFPDELGDRVVESPYSALLTKVENYERARDCGTGYRCFSGAPKPGSRLGNLVKSIAMGRRAEYRIRHQANNRTR